MAKQLLSFVAIAVAGSLTLRGATSFQMASSNPRQAATSLDARALSRRETLAAASVPAAVLAGLAPQEALAAVNQDLVPAPSVKPDRATADKFFFNGVFRDRHHPEGYRVVAGGANKAGTGTVTLKDAADGAAIEAPLVARRDESTGRLLLTIDLSGYDSRFSSEITATVNKDGSIRFPDGNVWTKEGGLVGVYIDGFAPYPKFRRLVLPGRDQTLASVAMVGGGGQVFERSGVAHSVVMVSGKRVIEASGVDLGKKGLQVNFPGKACAGRVDRKRGTIAWADGNVWTKV